MSALTSHTTLMHGDYGTMCDICSKIIKGPAAFKRHQLEHQGIVEPKVQCDLCGSWHKDKLSLAKHKRRHTYREQPQVCNVCQKTYASREALYRHKRFVHESDGKYECNICKKSFKMANSLKEHMSQHTGLSLYRCPHCSRTFNNNSNMHKHRKHMHPKEFEEFRRLRKISARSKEPILPTISFLSDATKDPGVLPILSSNLQELMKEDKQDYLQYELDTLQ